VFRNIEKVLAAAGATMADLAAFRTARDEFVDSRDCRRVRWFR
jgi:hypothetical protein